MKDKYTKEDYNAEPVYYCKYCLSLNIRSLPGEFGTDFCEDCNSTEIGVDHVSRWEALYKAKYGVNYLKNNI